MLIKIFLSDLRISFFFKIKEYFKNILISVLGGEKKMKKQYLVKTKWTWKHLGELGVLWEEGQQFQFLSQ